MLRMLCSEPCRELLDRLLALERLMRLHTMQVTWTMLEKTQTSSCSRSTNSFRVCAGRLFHHVEHAGSSPVLADRSVLLEVYTDMDFYVLLVLVRHRCLATALAQYPCNCDKAGLKRNVAEPRSNSFCDPKLPRSLKATDRSDLELARAVC